MFAHVSGKRLCLLFAVLLMALCCIAAAPVEDLAAEPTEIRVTVGIFDYTAVSAELKGASKDGIILNTREVKVPAGSMAIDALEKALQDGKIEYKTNSGDYGKYLTAVNGLGEMSGGQESGWVFCLNGDYANVGAGAAVVKDGDRLEMHYSMKGYGTDVGNYWDGLPYLTGLKLADTELKLSSETSYDENWNAKTSYYLETATGKQALVGQGTENDPFLLTIVYPEAMEISALTAEYSSSLHPHYQQVEPELSQPQDYSQPLDLCLSVKGGSLKTWYRITLVEPGSLLYWDIPYSHWAYTYIYDLSRKGVVTGNTSGGFAPDANVKRCDFVTMLARMSGDTLPVSGLRFQDVPENAYYAQAVSWAVDAGIVQGLDQNYFGPEQSISRQDIAVMLYRYAKYKQAAVEKLDAERLGEYSDGLSSSIYAVEAMEWSLDMGLLNGFSDGTLRPQAKATRAAAAKMLSCLLHSLE